VRADGAPARSDDPKGRRGRTRPSSEHMSISIRRLRVIRSNMCTRSILMLQELPSTISGDVDEGENSVPNEIGRVAIA
jgi:hypothetical protein